MNGNLLGLSWKVVQKILTEVFFFFHSPWCNVKCKCWHIFQYIRQLKLVLDSLHIWIFLIFWCYIGFETRRSVISPVFILFINGIVSNINFNSLNDGDLDLLSFIDYKRAFDSVNRDDLWNKLFDSGVGSKMLNMI